LALIRDFFAIAQGLLAVRVAARMLGTAAGDAIARTARVTQPSPSLAAIVPVLDEAARLEPALEGLIAQPRILQQILIVDGGSTDGTQAIVRRFAARDPRVVLVEAHPPAAGWNGKAWNLAAGLAATDPRAEWILTMDADVRPGSDFASSLLAHAQGAFVDAFSAAPRFKLSGMAEAAIHPAFLATLVYRCGLPGNVAQSPARIVANGQCFVAKRALLVRTNAFAAARSSRCEDVTIARHLVSGGAQVGFFEAGSLAFVEMYASAAECFAGWPRSLPLKDGTTSGVAIAFALTEIALVQTLPLAIVAATLALRGRTDSLAFRLNVALVLMRLGVLAGTRRAYDRPPPTFWLSLVCDIPVTLSILRSTFTRNQVWRGRTLVHPAVAG
jgi:dolichol-phosphate mannosyltransferase